MEQDIKQKLDELEAKLEEVRRTVVMIKKIFIWTMVITVAMFVLPLIGLAFIIPQIFSTYQELGGGF